MSEDVWEETFEGDPVEVLYDPENPTRSVALDVGWNPIPWPMLIGGLLANLGGGALVYVSNRGTATHRPT